MKKLTCPECGAHDVRVTIEALTGVADGAKLVLDQDGETLLLVDEKRKRYTLDDLNRAELAWCASCTTEDTLAAFVQDTPETGLVEAALVILLDERIRAWLEANDPKALGQLEAAVGRVQETTYPRPLADYEAEHAGERPFTGGAEALT